MNTFMKPTTAVRTDRALVAASVRPGAFIGAEAHVSPLRTSTGTAPGTALRTRTSNQTLPTTGGVAAANAQDALQGSELRMAPH